MAEEHGSMRLALVIEAIDKATAPINKVSAALTVMAHKVEEAQAPFNRFGVRLQNLQKAWSGFAEAVGLERLHERMNEVGEATERAEKATRELVEMEAYLSIAGGAVLEFLHKSAEGAERIEILSKQLGMTTDTFQKLSYAAQRAGVSQEAFAEGMGFLQRNIVEALRGNVQLEMTFQRIGITLSDLRHKSPEAILEKISDWMKRFPKEAYDGYVAMTLLGRGGREMVPFLQMGGEAIRALMEEAEKLGLITSEEQIKNATKFLNSWKLAITSVSSVATSAALDVLPKVTALIDKFNAWWQINKQMVGDGFKDFLEGYVKNLPQIAIAAGQVALAFLNLLKVVNLVAKLMGGWDDLIYIMATIRFVQFIFALGAMGKAIWLLAPTVLGVFGAMTRAVVGFGVALLTTPIGWILVGITLVAGLALLLWNRWEPIRKWWHDLWIGITDTIHNGVDKAMQYLGPLLRAMHLLSPADQINLVPNTGPAAAQHPVLSDQDRSRLFRAGAGLPTVRLGPAVKSPYAQQSHHVHHHARAQVHVTLDKGLKAQRARTSGPVDLTVQSGSLRLGEAH